jgi:hypothetical protein
MVDDHQDQGKLQHDQRETAEAVGTGLGRPV